MTEKTDVPTIGKTPQKQIASETPKTAKPSVTATWGGMLAMLGDPTNRYGRLVRSDRISMTTKLEMLSDPVVAITAAYVSSKLVKAEYEIRCKDPTIQRFFEAMYGAFHREFMLQASMAVLLGSCGLIKKLSFEVPKPIEESDAPAWTSSTTPYICTGFDQADPVGARPKFNKDGGYEGFSYSGGDVDRVYSLWLTIGRHMAFGKYSGWGRLTNVYKMWWLGEFGYDQLAVHMQKFVDRAIIMDFPAGKTQGGLEHSDIAIAKGDDVRSGATVALPSTVYSVLDTMSGEEKLTAVRKWAVRLLDNAENIDAFIKLADHLDSRKAMSLLLPFQTYQAVKQSSLGGPTTADVLGKLATNMVLGEANELDMHVNEYLFPAILQWNYGPDAPRVVKRTTGLNEYDRGELFELLKILAATMDSTAPLQIDVEELAHRLDVPMSDAVMIGRPKAEEPEPEEPAPVEDSALSGISDRQAEEASAAAAYAFARGEISLAGFMGRMGMAFDPEKALPQDVVDKILSETLGPESDDDQAAVITAEDVRRVVKTLEDIPELQDLETVEVLNEQEPADQG